MVKYLASASPENLQADIQKKGDRWLEKMINDVEKRYEANKIQTTERTKLIKKLIGSFNMTHSFIDEGRNNWDVTKFEQYKLKDKNGNPLRVGVSSNGLTSKKKADEAVNYMKSFLRGKQYYEQEQHEQFMEGAKQHGAKMKENNENAERVLNMHVGRGMKPTHRSQTTERADRVSNMHVGMGTHRPHTIGRSALHGQMLSGITYR